jgi:hypothetical protein
MRIKLFNSEAQGSNGSMKNVIQNAILWHDTPTLYMTTSIVITIFFTTACV